MFLNIKQQWKKFLSKLLFKADLSDLNQVYTERINKIKTNLFQYYQTKGPAYSSLFLVEDGKWNFNENNSTITFVFPHINTYIQVHSCLSKPYSTLELMGISRTDWEKYQIEQNKLRSDLSNFEQIKFIEFFWDDAIDYLSVAKKIKVKE